MYYLKRKKSAEKPKKTAKRGLIEKLDRVFSRYIRLRDALPGGYFRCIACDRFKPIADADCGHYHSRTHMATRYDEDNCHAECRHCNRFRADHLIGYRENLIRKIGTPRYELLNSKAHTSKKWSEWELQQLIVHYTEAVKSLEREKSIKL